MQEKDSDMFWKYRFYAYLSEQIAEKRANRPNLGHDYKKLKTFSEMVITFNELRRIKDKLPSGSSQRIADELGIEIDTVRNYFGGSHFNNGALTGVHFEKGPDGGVVTLDDTTIYEAAMRILGELKN